MISNHRGLLLSLVVFSSGGLQAEDEWDFELAPYAWFVGMEGDVATIKELPTSEYKLSPSDAFADTDSSLMLIFGGKKGQHGFYTDLYYSDVDSEVLETKGLTIESITETTMLTVGYTYEIFNNSTTIVDLVGGARWWHIDAEIDFGSPIPALNFSGDNTEVWVDPFIGIKGKIFFPDSKFYAVGGAGYGGFGVGSDSVYELTANIGYQWTESIGTVLGYRYYDLDYDESSFTYLIKQQGWQVGLTWGF